MLKQIAKTALKKAGVFPIARLAYRRINPAIVSLRRREIQLYRELLPPNALCFDIGANLGQKSDIFLAAGFRSVVVEPNEHCQASLRLQFARNPKAIIVKKALGETPGKMDLYADGSDATASLLASWHRSVYGTDCLTKQPVEVTTIDRLIEEYGRPDYIKIDVEGFENEVLRGLSYPVPLLSIEFHATQLDMTAECLATLLRLGKLSVRAADMLGHWLCQRMAPEEIFSFIRATQAKGDLYIWIDSGDLQRIC